VVVAVIAMRMMQASLDQVVNVVTVGNRFVAASRTVRVVVLAGNGSALVGVTVGHIDHVLIHVVAMREMQVAVVEVFHLILLSNRRMPAVRTVLMGVILVLVTFAFSHTLLLLLTGSLSKESMAGEPPPPTVLLRASRDEPGKWGRSTESEGCVPEDRGGVAGANSSSMPAKRGSKLPQS
jgi:hypothetical protein